MDSGEGFDVDLTADQTVVKIKVSANGVWQRYHLTLNRTAVDPSNEARLSALSVLSGSTVMPLTKTFSSDTFEYGCNIPYATSSFTIKPTAISAEASITVNGTAVSSGAQSRAYTIEPGKSVSVPVVVTAADGITAKTYTVTVSRADELSNNARLSALTISAVGTWAP